MIKTKDYFQPNKNNISYVGSQFLEVFGKMEFKIPKKLELQAKILERSMTDKEILAEFKPKESTLGELTWAMKNEKKMLKNGYANIFYIRDNKGTLWAVHARWYVGRGGWGVFAASVARPSRWGRGCRVVSQTFSVFDPLDSWNLDGEIMEIRGKKYKLSEVK